MKIVFLKCTSIVAALLFLFFAPVMAQVKIGSAGNPSGYAVLELDGGTNKGLLLPRLTNTQITALNLAPDGLLVYNTTDGFLYIRKNAAWQKMSDATNAGGGGLTLPYNGSSSGATPLFVLNSTANADALRGYANAGDGITGGSVSGNGGYFSSTTGNALVTFTGNVGIATINPQFQLDVNGRARIRSNGALNSAGIWYDRIYTTGPGSFAGTLNDSSFGIFGSGDWKFAFDHVNNRLGINNSDPKAPLSFSNATGNKLDIYYGSDNSRYGIGLQASLMQFYSSGAGDDIAFGYGSSTAFTERMRIKGNGNVGIGTTNPTLGGLVVDKKAGAVNAIFGSNTTGVAIETDYPGIGLNTYYNNGRKIMNTGYGGLLGLDPTTGTINLYSTAASVTGQGTAATLNARLTILANGNVGIGNTDPQADLALSNTVGNKIDLFSVSPSSKYGIGVQSGRLQLYTATASDNIVFGYGTSAIFYEKMRIQGNGNVGVGTTTPNSKWQVAGSVSMPFIEVTDNYTITDNDYTVRFVTQFNTNVSKTITLPAAAGRAGRIYKIYTKIPLSGPADISTFTPTRVYLVEAGTNINVIQANLDGTDYYQTFSFENYQTLGGVNYNTHGVFKKLSLTVQSDGTSWKVIEDSFMGFRDYKEEE